MGANGAMLAMNSANSVGTFATAYQQSEALKRQGDYQKRQHDFNAQMADRAGAEAIKRGEENSNKIKREGKRVAGSQRVALAAQGIEVDSGNAADLQAETANMTAMDALTVKNNAWREAWGFKVEAMNSRSSGQWAQMSGRHQAQNTLLAGGMKALTQMGQGLYEYDKNRPSKPTTKAKTSGGGVSGQSSKVGWSYDNGY